MTENTEYFGKMVRAAEQLIKPWRIATYMSCVAVIVLAAVSVFNRREK